MHTVTRFPPSPTGDLHLGGARTALFNWLYAHKTGGEMVLRIEDTDRARSTPEAVEVILESLKWLGLDWQRGPIYQSERGARHREIIRRLVGDGCAYYCFCERPKAEAARAAGEMPRHDMRCRDAGRQPRGDERAVVRFRNPLTGAVVFDDVVRGKVRVENSQLDDLVIARADGTPTYNLAAVVDDLDFGVTHVIRGDDHINNTPRQINIYRALGAAPPVFAHVPLIFADDGRRLSKRHGAVSVLEYRDMGILPAALLNYLARLGWSHGDQEIFTTAEMIELFDLAGVHKSPAVFDLDKLLWVNQKYMQTAAAEYLACELTARLQKRGLSTDRGPAMVEVVEALRARARTLEEMAEQARYFYADVDAYNEAAARKHLQPSAAKLLQAAQAAFAALKPWRPAEISATLQQIMNAHAVQLGKIAQPLRVAVSGGATTPPIDTTLYLVGKSRTLKRVQQALDWIAERNSTAAEIKYPPAGRYDWTQISPEAVGVMESSPAEMRAAGKK